MKRLSDELKPKKKKHGFGKQKGGEYERTICKQLSLWVTNGEREDIFWRSAMSGGRASVNFKAGKENRTQTGDISAIDPLGDWYIKTFVTEIKSYKQLDIASGIIQQKGLLYGFWMKLEADSKKVNKEPLLICKQNRVSPIVVTSIKGEVSLHLNPQQALAILPHWPARLYSLAYLLGTKYAKRPITRLS